jgi:hypothetical protein
MRRHNSGSKSRCHKILYNFHFFMHAIFIHVTTKDLNFTTVSKDFITYIISVILSCILPKRHTHARTHTHTHTQKPIILGNSRQTSQKILEFVNILSYSLNFSTDVKEQIKYSINSIRVAAYRTLHVTMVTRVERSKCNSVSCAQMVDVHDS